MFSCMRCGEVFDASKSAYVLVVSEKDWGWGVDVIRVVEVEYEDCAVHLNGDRACVRTLAGYRRKIAKKLGLSSISEIRSSHRL